jgi:hypothetical protein
MVTRMVGFHDVAELLIQQFDLILVEEFYVAEVSIFVKEFNLLFGEPVLFPFCRIGGPPE